MIRTPWGRKPPGSAQAKAPKCLGVRWTAKITPLWRGQYQKLLSTSCTLIPIFPKSARPGGENRQRNPMLLFEFAGPLFKFALNTPELVPVFQLPPRRTAPAEHH